MYVNLKLELPRRTERFGSVRINDIQRVLLLDSAENNILQETSVSNIPREKLQEIEQKMAIIIPVKDERLNLFEGVISAIPSECLIIAVSNSKQDDINRFKMELEMIEQHVHFTKRVIWIIHQKDLGLGDAIKKVGYKDILDDQGLVRNGKAEGMLLGMLLAKAAEKDYVGFVDADNYIPGAVHEYVKIFAASFCLAKSPYTMVRISWAYKPKILEGSLYFSKWGRVSEVTNKYLNKLIATYTGFDTEVVKTSNSGDHAITMKLAEILDYRSRFAVEPNELVNILEQFGGITKPKFSEPMEKGVEIFQIETRNPHFHEEKGDEHIKGMVTDALSAITASHICPDSLKKEIYKEYSEDELTSKAKEKPMRNFARVDTKKFLDHITKSNTLLVYGKQPNQLLHDIE